MSLLKLCQKHVNRSIDLYMVVIVFRIVKVCHCHWTIHYCEREHDNDSDNKMIAIR